jgi:Protein of unknown function (DUF997)
MPDQPADPNAPAPFEYDPIYTHARRELVVSLLAFLIFGIWVIGFSWIAGRRQETDPDSIPTILGMPTWVFWGVALPWVVANVFTFWFCFRYMTDHPLEIVEDEVDPETSPSADQGGNRA